MPEPPADPTFTQPGSSTDGSATMTNGGSGAPRGAPADPMDLLASPEVPAFPEEEAPYLYEETPEVGDMLHHEGRDLELHSDWEQDVVAVSAALPGRSAPGSRRTVSFLKRLGWGFWVAVGFCVLIILLAIFAGVLPLPNPDKSVCIPNAGPSSAHWLGCDEDGRDVLSRVIFGSRVSLIVGFASIALALAIGGSLAVVAGFMRGAFDSVTGVLANVILALPYLVLALCIVSFWGNSLFQVTIVIAIVAVAPLYRVVRANTISFSEREYVLAARALGSNRKRILGKQIIPDVVPTAITYALVGVALAITGEGALSYLGQSVPLPTPTWGNMIAEGSGQIPSIGTGVPVNIWIMLGPAIFMFAFILAINLVGDKLRTTIDVRGGVL